MLILGVDIFNHLDSLGKQHLLGQIDGLVGRRNAIAHGEVLVTCAYTDVDHSLVVVQDFAREADAGAARSVQSTCALHTLPW